MQIVCLVESRSIIYKELLLVNNKKTTHILKGQMTCVELSKEDIQMSNKHIKDVKICSTLLAANGYKRYSSVSTRLGVFLEQEHNVLVRMRRKWNSPTVIIEFQNGFSLMTNRLPCPSKS